MKTIYVRTNLINGMQYVGQTKDFKNREYAWKCYKLRYANEILTADREKYGLENWKVEVLKECEDSDGDYWEQHFIKELNTKFPNGYNITDGGIGPFGLHLTPWNKGIPMSEGAKLKLSRSLKGKASWMKGKHHTEEARKKMSKALKWKSSPKKKMVYQYTLDENLVKIWDSATEASKNNFDRVSITNCCNGKRQTHKGYKWSYKPL